jgi:tripartite-type tricarboxylate transporter receptor subunit TctC
MKLLSTAASLLIGLVAVTAAPMAIAQDYPKKPVTIYVPFAAGGITDVLGRIVAQELSTSLHGQFVVENKPGGGTAVATMATINAEPDGYTLLMVPNATLSTNPTLYKSLPYHPLQDLKPIALVGSIPFLLLASTQFAAKSIPELIRMARENPGKINYGSGGAGTNGAIFMDMFQTMTGTKMVHIPYRGSSPQLTDTISGQVQIGFADASTTKDIVLAGKLRALGVSSEKRFDGLPDVPTLSEAGVTGFNAESWQMLVGPAKMPPSIANLLNAKINAFLSKPEVIEKMKNLGVIPGGKGNVQELTEFVKSEEARWGEVIRKAGLAGSL